MRSTRKITPPREYERIDPAYRGRGRADDSAGSGFVALGAEAFYFDQLTCDSGNGATLLGCFEGETAGLGPVLGYILPLGA
ncbi:MAG: hypothetical protein IPG06_22730 [Haliea sp.]|nr:hypothetical protein [Haliea sp.]